MHEEVCHSSHSKPIGIENENKKAKEKDGMLLGLIALVVGKVRRLLR